jgi:hypothetical protein
MIRNAIADGQSIVDVDIDGLSGRLRESRLKSSNGIEITTLVTVGDKAAWARSHELDPTYGKDAWSTDTQQTTRSVRNCKLPYPTRSTDSILHRRTP